MKPLHTSEFIGASLTIVGSFLPWERAGDWLSYVSNGIRVDAPHFKYWITGIHEFPIYDNGGVLVVFLTLAIILLAIQPPRFVTTPSLAKLMISVLLMGSALFFVARWLIHRYEYGNAVGRPTLMIGLVCVVLGSGLLLWRAMLAHRQFGYPQTEKAG
jgi:hypothetical protein